MEMAEKKQIKDCTLDELIEHFELQNGKELIITQKGCALKKGTIVIQFSNTDAIKIMKEVN